ncbi:hypothetical protein [Gordonibacter sp. An230]|uniref:hypothetical protein n=1 Tax=Gordonibacter sp. An230 TaxID=1965592 RepID=UPI0011243E85|nr:hypothetical protein [Gordonibacter sp. An230]
MDNELHLFDDSEGVPISQWDWRTAMLLDHPFDQHRGLIEEWSKDFYDRDNKIVKEFQATFRSAFWELYLNNVFRSLGFKLGKPQEAPDFSVVEPCKMSIEAVVAKAKKDSPPESTRGMLDHLSMVEPPWLHKGFNELLNESIVRHSNALCSKRALFDSYKKRGKVSDDEPYVIALSSHDQIRSGAEYIYPMMALLYGCYYDSSSDKYTIKDNVVKPGKNATIPIGLFAKKEWACVSAVLYSCTTTIGKLDALCASQSENAQNAVCFVWRDYSKTEEPYYLHHVTPETPEILTEGLFVFHNPFADNPVALETFLHPGIEQLGSVGNGQGIGFCSDAPRPMIARISFDKRLGGLYFPLIEERLNAYNLGPDNSRLYLI